jgi:hypothetical protein
MTAAEAVKRKATSQRLKETSEMTVRSAALCRVFLASLTAALVSTAMIAPGSAQMRGTMKTRIVDAVANQMVASIQNDSCAEFAAMLKSRKSGSSAAGGMMKKDPAARARFVNKVAGPLVNKMIDCDLLPNR